MDMAYGAKKPLSLLAAALMLFSLSACKSMRGGLGFEFGEGKRQEHYHTAKKGGPPPHAPAHGYRAKHRYRYYPDCSVYYDPGREIYFYLEGANWHVGASLPRTIRVEYGDYVNIEMDTDTPYIHHDEHKHKYPPGQLKEKNKEKKHKWKG